MFCRLRSKNYLLQPYFDKNADANGMDSCWHQFKAHQNRPLAGDDLADEKEVQVEGL